MTAVVQSDPNGGQPGQPPPLGFWASGFWILATSLATFVTAIASVAILDSLVRPKLGITEGSEYIAPIISLAFVFLLVEVVRRARWRVKDYFAFFKPSWLHIVVALAGGATFPFIDNITGIFIAAGQPDTALFDNYQQIRTANVLPLFWINVVVAAPIAEEMTFRGFLYRGWSQTRLGPSGAIILTALIFAIAHLQYDWHAVLSITISGVFLGWLRWWSGSLFPSLMAHAAGNALIAILLALPT